MILAKQSHRRKIGPSPDLAKQSHRTNFGPSPDLAKQTQCGLATNKISSKIKVLMLDIEAAERHRSQCDFRNLETRLRPSTPPHAPRASRDPRRKCPRLPARQRPSAARRLAARCEPT